FQQLLFGGKRERQELGQARAHPGARIEAVRRGQYLGMFGDHALEQANTERARRRGGVALRFESSTRARCKPFVSTWRSRMRKRCSPPAVTWKRPSCGICHSPILASVPTSCGVAGAPTS